MIVAAISNGLLTLVVFGGAVIIALLTGAGRWRTREDRSWRLQELAEELKFDEFNPDPDQGFAMGWGFLNNLNRGENRYAFNILRGKYHEQSLFVFNYHYETGSDKNKVDHNLTVLMLVVKEVFPQMTIGPESFGDKIATAFGVENDIKFESAEFSRAFCVRSGDKKFAYDVCNVQMIDYLLANRDLHIEIQGPVILLAFSQLVPVGQIELNLQRLVEIRTLMPNYLFTQS
jgi:hypothetical protein